MRKIEQQMLAAIKSGKNWKSRNTEVRHNECPMTWQTHVYLHGNLIAKLSPAGKWEISLAGWNTATTRSRLTAIIREFSRVGTQGLGVSTNKRQPYLHDVRGKVAIDSTGWHKVYC
jgi:hypothetical protein